MWYVIIGNGTGTQFFVGAGVLTNRRGKFKFLGLQGDLPQLPPLVGHSNLPIRETLKRVLVLLTLIVLKRVSESIFFESNKFTACKVKDKKEVANYLMAFSLMKTIHPFQGKKHLRTS